MCISRVSNYTQNEAYVLNVFSFVFTEFTPFYKLKERLVSLYPFYHFMVKSGQFNIKKFYLYGLRRFMSYDATLTAK